MRATLITFLTLILIVGGVFLFFTFSSDTGFHSKWYASSIDQVPLSYAESIIAQKKTESEDIALLNSAIENLKIETCQKILAPSRRTECVDMLLAAEALDTDSFEKCKTLTDPDRAIQCQDNIYTSRAEKGGDKNLCTSVTAKNLRIFCEKEIDTVRLKVALEKNTLSPEFCASLIDGLTGECQKSLDRVDSTTAYADALAKKDPTLCDALTDETLRHNCHDAIVLQIALAEKNTDFCETIIDTAKKLYCENTLTTRNDSKRFQDVVAMGDIGQCNIFSDKKLQYQCSDMITMVLVRSTHDQNLCGNLFNTGMQFACMQIAHSTTK